MVKIIQQAPYNLQSKLHLIVQDTIVDDPRRSIILDCRISSTALHLQICIDLTLMSQTSPFFESTFKELCKLPNKTKSIVGDFVLNTDNDKFGGNAELHQMPRNIILNYIENLNLTEIWHHLHP